MEKSHTLLGVRFDAVTRYEALERMRALVEKARQENSPASSVVTVNVQILVNARHRFPQLMPIINSSPLVVADGAPLVFLSRIFRPRLPERVAGSDLIYDIAVLSAKNGYRIYFFGGEEASVLEAIELLKKMNPALIVAGHSSPFIDLNPNAAGMEKEAEICRQIKEAQTDILLVGLGNPKQELFVHRNAERLSGMVSIGLGGTFNFLSGRVRRAPRWVQRLGMEWIYRIIQEPRRLFFRYFIDGFFLIAYVFMEPFRRL